MTIADNLDPPPLALPPRPARPLSSLQFLRVAQHNSLAACDSELFDELIVERRLFGRRLFIVSDPDGIRRVLRDNHENFPRLASARRVFEFHSGTGMLAAEGDVWLRHRRLLRQLLDHRAIRADVPVLIDLAQQLTDHLVRLAPGQPIDIGETFAHLVTAFTGRVFAADERAIDPVLYRLGQYPGRYSLLDFIPMPHWLRGLDRRQTRVRTRACHPLLDRLIAERKRNDYAGSHDLLWRLANAADERSGDRLSPEEIRDEALTLGATAATPLRIFPWIWYLLALYPGAEARLHAELDAAFGDRSPSPETLLGLTFLRQVIDEAMRLYPPSPVMLRTTLADDVVCERRIPRKSVVVIMPWIVHRHRRLWDDPDRFDPERFAVERAATRPRDAYLPFSVGPHACFGSALAIVEILAGVAVVAQRVRFRLVPGQTVEPIAWTNLHPRFGIRMTVEPR
jgi:cytochrome P450